MSNAVFEFPLNEKVRTYLRLEQLFKQLKQGLDAKEDWQRINFFETLFTLLDLLERLDIRNDMLKDIEIHEKNLVHWSQHPNIDNEALQGTLQRILRLRDELKNAKRVGSALKDDKFLASIRQRFSIPGGTCSFDLPNLHYWLKQPDDNIHKDIQRWCGEFELFEQAIGITLSFLRERGRFTELTATNGFFQGVADDKNELIRVYSQTDKGYYPVLSGNKYRYALRFMWFTPDPNGSAQVDTDVTFQLASC
ncbi:cell division protein ZapD [Aestuariibacter halophilus]|uniref:Cell division protein ZapD n=1 Tax=Fluctibacter halophilus TaxID=226011 RepID=A0ABS8G8H8_9ALTE|nr:cell division protein ZapD [Aestuariibacter halophilus]MCC2616466.1 cell division protein ZapD [Aestuariibacter halophilus]